MNAEPVEAVDTEGRPRGVAGPLVGLAVWLAVVVAASTSSPVEQAGIGASPFYGRWELHDLRGLIPAAMFAGLAVAAWPLVSRRLPMSALAVVSGATSVVWAALLAASGGVDRLWTPLTSKYDYLGVAPELDAGRFLRTFVDRLGTYPTHVKGHPPGMPLVLRALEAAGLAGPKWAAVVMLLVWGLGVAAVVAAITVVSGTTDARQASAPVAFLPAVVFVATTFDAFFAGAMALAIALLVMAARWTGWRSDLTAVLGGSAAAACLHLSYGLVPLGLVPLVMMVRYRRVRPLLIAAVGAAVVFVAFVANGFWWLDGLHATRGFYAEGISQVRPYALFVFVVNPAALALCVGPVVAVAWGSHVSRRELPRPALLLAGAALVAVVTANLSGLSNGETERIWLPFMPWIAVAAGGWFAGRRQRALLAVTLTIGLVIQAMLVTPW